MQSKLEDQYLWADRFCIVQDDDGEMSQISNMSHIYGEAYLATIAASSDSIFSQQISLDCWPNEYRRTNENSGAARIAADFYKNDSDIPNGWTKKQSPTSDSSACAQFTFYLDNSPKFRCPILLSSANSVMKDDPNPCYLMGCATSASFIAAAVMVSRRQPLFEASKLCLRAAPKISAFEEKVFSTGPSHDEAC
ncbi:uncharacterized protein UV8b_00350 [Ustilaginoidea virens]|uniref:Heterokaryon incompatibility domain-containing protein n=1 Tax=Ustilaginoidea virens TaxID=1159556 RepID=A0A8E5HJJ1_USTVR|nr:uncharacterized protein UV8b_00350 [Ustilaginoidea virens]QUC16109.1 hypothetical protein UV8b_00350 [Ustilaginoidea virens]